MPTLEKARTIDPEAVHGDVRGRRGRGRSQGRGAGDRRLPEGARHGSPTIGGRIPRGILLVGPPGTGKTLLARSMAGEAGVPFISASGSDFVEMYAGVGASRVRKLFKEARRHKSCIIFIDELDAVGRNRGGNSLEPRGARADAQPAARRDGRLHAQSDSIIVVCRHQPRRHPRLRRCCVPGRFDRQVTVGNPDIKGREQILRVHARKVALEARRRSARDRPRHAGLLRRRSGQPRERGGARSRRAPGGSTVGNGDLDAARDKVLMGVERKSVAMSEHERITCAYHEAGHAVVAALLPDADPLHKVTIIPRGRALGVTMQLPEADRYTHMRSRSSKRRSRS